MNDVQIKFKHQRKYKKNIRINKFDDKQYSRNKMVKPRQMIWTAYTSWHSSFCIHIHQHIQRGTQFLSVHIHQHIRCRTQLSSVHIHQHTTSHSILKCTHTPTYTTSHSIRKYTHTPKYTTRHSSRSVHIY